MQDKHSRLHRASSRIEEYKLLSVSHLMVHRATIITTFGTYDFKARQNPLPLRGSTFRKPVLIRSSHPEINWKEGKLLNHNRR